MTQEPVKLNGTVTPQFEPVRQLFESMLQEDATYSAGVCAYVGGGRVVDLVGGPDLHAAALVPVFSSTKGASGMTIALLIERGGLDLDAPVAHYWPEFAASGKEKVTVRQLLSHQAGLVAVDGGFSLEELTDHEPLAHRLAAQMPFWYPGTARGYHALTIGVLAEELVRRITGTSLPAFYEAEVRGPAGLDFFVGVPEPEMGRVQPVLPYAVSADELAALYQQLAPLWGPGTLAYAAFSRGRPDFPEDIRDLANHPRVQRVGPPAAGGVATAAGLAGLYARTLGGTPLLSPQTVAAVSQLQSRGPDLVVLEERAYAILFEKATTATASYNSYRAFGHGGAGGSIAFADPEFDLAFGFLPARMTLPGDQRGPTLAAAMRTCILT